MPQGVSAAAAAARCLCSISVVGEGKREKRRPFDSPISNGNVCIENEEAQKNA